LLGRPMRQRRRSGAPTTKTARVYHIGRVQRKQPSARQLGITIHGDGAMSYTLPHGSPLTAAAVRVAGGLSSSPYRSMGKRCISGGGPSITLPWRGRWGVGIAAAGQKRDARPGVGLANEKGTVCSGLRMKNHPTEHILRPCARTPPIEPKLDRGPSREGVRERDLPRSQVRPHVIGPLPVRGM